MLNELASCGTMVVVARTVAEPEGAAERIRALAGLWSGPISLILLDADSVEAAERLPEGIEVLAAGGEVADALRSGHGAALAEAAASALLGAAARRAPLDRVLFVACRETLRLLPAFAAASFPRPIEVELLPSAGTPDADFLWENADGVVIADDSRLYPLASSRPALPVRVVPTGDDIEARRAQLAWPTLGGEPRTSVVVPVRGQAALVQRMVESVLDRTSGLVELILVDDASPNGTFGKLERLADRERLIRLVGHKEQRGFAATCNHGLAMARGESVLILNADTVVTEGWAARLHHHVEMQPRAGVAGPLSNRVAGLQQLAPVDYDERTLLGLAPYSERIGRVNAGKARGVVRLTGLCLAFSRPALRRIGGFDARFFPGNYEDDDYCMRLLAGGLVPYLADDVFIHHEGSKSFALEPTSYRALLEANWGRFKEKWGLPDDRPIERSYSPEELPLGRYDRAVHFVAPWLALEPASAATGA